MQYNKTESKIIPYVIAKIDFNHTWPLALYYGSHPYGGLGLRKLKTEALIQKILAIQSHIRIYYHLIIALKIIF